MNAVDIERLLAELSLEDKCRLLSGIDFWHTAANEEHGIPSMMVTDGPHGLRKQVGDSMQANLHASVPATCFPTASASACSFDTDLLFQMGAALGEECRGQDVGVILGPGMSMKRSPLCGRNFEYFSEDPLLSGELAAAMANGIQSQGVGACLKHYIGNNQEKNRLIVDSVIDERAMHEIYLKGFEIAVGKCRPWMIMTAYNRLNGSYCSQNECLLHCARDEWGFDGAFITDWGALSESVPSVDAGLDLVMPGPRPDHTAKLVDAVANGELAAEKVDDAARHVLELLQKHEQGFAKPFTNDFKAHNELASRIAEESAVLLENDGILPLKPSSSLAVIGSFAMEPRYQGAGSSRINPLQLENSLSAIIERAESVTFARGTSPHHADTFEDLMEEAESAARLADIALVFIGLPVAYESEGFDRTDMDMPRTHLELLERVCAVNPNVVVVLQGGAPMNLSWRDKPRAILLSYLAGEQGGRATAKILFGEVNPSGKLAETWPEKLEDTPCAARYPDRHRSIHYLESLYVGYRYYDAAKLEVAYPFGYGLSYTTFDYRDLHIERTGDTELEVSCTIANTGEVFGREVVQLYVAALDPGVFKAPQELKAFAKVGLEAGEGKPVHFKLDRSAFSHWDSTTHGWAIEGGCYEIRIGSSSRNVRLRETVEMAGCEKQKRDPYLIPYYRVRPGGFTEEAFRVLYGRPLPLSPRQKRPFTIDSTLDDMHCSLISRIIKREALKVFDRRVANGEEGAKAERAMFPALPVRSFVMGMFDMSAIESLVLVGNGHLIRAVKRFRNKYRNRY